VLPETFPSPLFLPFNSECVKERLSLLPPGPDGGEAGVWAILRGTELLVREGEPPGLSFGLLPEELRALEPKAVRLGTWDGRPCRALALSRATGLPPGLVARDILASRPDLPVDLLSLGGVAGQVLHWERGSRFCSRCGGSLEPIAGEWGKSCPPCGALHYPHIHPCAIVLVRRPGEVLLTRKAEWPPGRYSLVAGFLEFGESLEEAAAREVLEETGIRIRDVRYVGSQCWPFPSQLMAGFVAEYDGGEVQVEEKELEDARWFPVDDLPSLPPKRSIARFLLDHHIPGV